MGDHTKYGGYRIDYDRVRTYVVPEGLKDFQVCCTLSRPLYSRIMESLRRRWPAYAPVEFRD